MRSNNYTTSYTSNTTSYSNNLGTSSTGNSMDNPSKYQYSSNTTSNTSGTVDRESARNVARRIMEAYDRDRNGVIDTDEIVPMIIDAYKGFNKVFSPSKNDIMAYLKTLDRNGDGKVTLQDIEELCFRYLTQR